MELKKTYKGFVVWLIAFCAASILVCFLPIGDYILMIRLVCNICSLGVAVLAIIIYKTEYVYWYNGTSYEEAVEAGAARRKAFAWKHVKSFGTFALFFLVYSILSQCLHIHYMIDIIIFTGGILAAAFGTMRYQL